MKKEISMNSPSVIKVGERNDDIFPVGFKYSMGNVIYTVHEIATRDPGSNLRKVITSDRDTEIMTIETIQKDLLEADTIIIDAKEDKNEK